MKTASAEILDLTADADLVAPALEISRVATAQPSKLVDCYELTKPRMNFLVLLTTAVGYFMASRESTNWWLLFNTLLGTGFCAAAAAVLNQVMEIDYDALMPRTKHRPLPAGRIAPQHAMAMGIGYATIGLAQLAIFVNPLTAVLGLLTMFTYLALYTPAKRITSLNTVIGAIPGAIPPMMGWAAVSNNLAPQAWALFGILFFWQMPHFLAIAILYRKDYAAGGFKMLPVLDEDLTMTGRQIILWGIALIPATLLPVLTHMAGETYFTAAVLLGLAFLSFGISCAATASRLDARKLFFASIIYLPVLLAVLMIDKV